MKTYKITLKDGKEITGISNGKIYAGSVYINRPENGAIKINGEESFRKSITISASDIKSVKIL